MQVISCEVHNMALKNDSRVNSERVWNIVRLWQVHYRLFRSLISELASFVFRPILLHFRKAV